MVFEYMRGNDMYNKIKNYKPLSEQQVFNYFSQLMKGFLFLQFHGVCHRDIKPDNILFVDENRLKIADFSLVENYNTKMKGICGTPGFMAPEIFYQETYDEKIDVFSLGAVLYVM